MRGVGVHGGSPDPPSSAKTIGVDVRHPLGASPHRWLTPRLARAITTWLKVLPSTAIRVLPRRDDARGNP
jgi:hypothetical protein